MSVDFKSLLEEMKIHGMPVPKSKQPLMVQNSKSIIENALKYFLSYENTEPIWRQEYDQISDWMTNTEGKGLFLYGDCGLGKSMFGRYVLPAVILKYCKKVVSVYDMNTVNKDIDLILTKPLLSIDDVGTEDLSNVYGNKRIAFAEIMDEVEKKGKFIIITTNFTAEQLEQKYGTRIIDRVISTTKRIKFSGKSLRR